MTITSPEDSVDRNVTRILRTVLANRGMSVNELALKSGIAKSTYFRRKVHGGWTASEIAALARALEVDPALFWRDPDGIIPGRLPTDGDDGTRPIRRLWVDRVA